MGFTVMQMKQELGVLGAELLKNDGAQCNQPVGLH